MALTAYQTQFKRRMKRAIRLRAKADQKARRHTQLLADAIGAAEDAATQMNALNQLYNVDVSTYTLLTQALHANSGQEVLVDHLAQSTPGEELVLFNQVPDGNGGQPLPDSALFGELVTAGPSPRRDQHNHGQNRLRGTPSSGLPQRQTGRVGQLPPA